MPRMKKRDALLHEFATLDTNRDLEQFEKLNVELRAYLAKHGEDEEISDALMLVEMGIAEHKKRGYHVSRRIVSHRLWQLCGVGRDYSFYELRMLGMILDYARYFSDTIDIAEAALVSLENYKHEERYINVKLAINANAAMRMLRSKYTLNENATYLKERDNAFERYTNEAVCICNMPELKEQLEFYLKVLNLRKHIYYGDYVTIDKTLAQMKKNEAEEAWRMAQDIVSEFNPYMGRPISEKQLNMMMSANMKKIRVIRDVTIEEAAEQLKIAPHVLEASENGGTHLSHHKLYQLACLLNVPPSLLYKDLSRMANSLEALEHAVLVEELVTAAERLDKDKLQDVLRHAHNAKIHYFLD